MVTSRETETGEENNAETPPESCDETRTSLKKYGPFTLLALVFIALVGQCLNFYRFYIAFVFKSPKVYATYDEKRDYCLRDCGESAECLSSDEYDQFVCVCKPGYVGNHIRGCTDIDECENGQHDCSGRNSPTRTIQILTERRDKIQYRVRTVYQ